VTIDKRFNLEGKQILRVEDTVTTGGTVKKTGELCTARGGIVLPTVAAWLDRSKKDDNENEGLIIVSVMKKYMPVYKVHKGETCELCTQGSEAIRPKAEASRNWKLLTAKYD
jgi:orotate phosphoribosyltransferase